MRKISVLLLLLCVLLFPAAAYADVAAAPLMYALPLIPILLALAAVVILALLLRRVLKK